MHRAMLYRPFSGGSVFFHKYFEWNQLTKFDTTFNTIAVWSWPTLFPFRNILILSLPCIICPYVDRLQVDTP